MLEIFVVQLLVAALGAVSTALADWLYRNSRIRQPLHSFWVSASIAVICVPVLVWICNVFLGSGLFGQLVAGLLVGAIYVWVYRSLRKVPSLQKFGTTPPSAAPFERRGSPGI
jgi:membrane associated rhomboid family serine protease